MAERDGVVTKEEEFLQGDYQKVKDPEVISVGPSNEDQLDITNQDVLEDVNIEKNLPLSKKIEAKMT